MAVKALTRNGGNSTGGGERTVPPLPASAEKVDRELVDRAATHIREVLEKTVTRGTEEVGRYLLRTFYDDDPQLYFSANPNKHASLRLLLDRCESLELPVRERSFLMPCVLQRRPKSYRTMLPFFSSHLLTALSCSGLEPPKTSSASPQGRYRRR